MVVPVGLTLSNDTLWLYLGPLSTRTLYPFYSNYHKRTNYMTTRRDPLLCYFSSAHPTLFFLVGIFLLFT